MISIQTLRKAKKAKVQKGNKFNSDVASLKYLNTTKFMLNNFVTDKNKDYVCVIEINDEVILVMDNYDVIDLKPRKIAITKDGCFRSKILFEILTEQLLKLDNNTSFLLEEVEMNGNFIGYIIKDSLLTNLQPTQAN